MLSIPAIAQDLMSREDFRNAEWRMKSEYYQNLLKRGGSNIVLDQTDFDVKYWELDIDVTNIVGQIIHGKVTMTSECTVDDVTTVDYDFHSNMTVDSAFMGGNPVSYTRPNNIVRITLDRTYNEGEHFTTVVYYHGHPPGGGWGSFSWDQHNGQPIISTLSEPEGAREWWPCKDMPHDKSDSSDVLITVPDYLVATSNGSLVSNVDNGNGTRTFQRRFHAHSQLCLSRTLQPGSGGFEHYTAGIGYFRRSFWRISLH
jgi:aminopeptidase N